MRIPFFPQQNDFYCGPAVVQMVLAGFGKRITQRQVALRARTNPKTGTTPAQLVRVLKHEGLRVRAGSRRSLAAITKAHTEGAVVIVLYIEPVWEWAHYAIVKKITAKNIVLLDPDACTGKTVMLIDEFLHRWRDNQVSHTKRWAAYVSEKPSAQQKKRRSSR